MLYESVQIKNINSFPIMLVIQFESIVQHQTKPAPLLLPITPQILQKQVSYLQELACLHFKDILSPFIRKQHLQLSTDKQVLKSDYPVFIYCNYKEYINNVVCTLKHYDQQIVLKRSYMLRNSIVLVKRKDYSEKIVKGIEMEKLDKMLNGVQTVCIGGREIQLINKANEEEGTQVPKKWSEFIVEKRSKFESPNQCVYLMI